MAAPNALADVRKDPMPHVSIFTPPSHSSRARSDRRAAGALPRLRLTAFLLAVLFGLATIALAGPMTSVDAPGGAWVGTAEAASTFGGTCGSSCDSGGNDDGDDEPRRVGSSYWRTTDRVLRSYDPGVADLIEHLANYDDRPLTYTFELSERTVRSVGFSGGYADYFRLSIGGETDRTRTRTVEKVIDPFEGLKVYQRQETRRYTVYGSQYQDYDDGSRTVIGTSSGPYTTSVTKTGYVTYALR